MKLSEFYCDYCNPSRQRRAEGDEMNTGYAVELGEGFPLGWWDVPRKGPDGTVGHCCPECVLHNEAAKADIQKRRSEDTARILGEELPEDGEADKGPGVDSGATTTSDRPKAGPSWPSITSPFEGSRDGGDGDVG